MTDDLEEAKKALKNLDKLYKNLTLQQKIASIIYEALEGNKEAQQKIANFNEEEQLAAVTLNGWAIEYIENPSEEAQLAAVTQYGLAILYIKKPSEEVQLAAVTQYGLAIESIKKPSEEVQLAAYKNGAKTGHLPENSEVRKKLETLEKELGSKEKVLKELKEGPSDEVGEVAGVEKPVNDVDKTIEK